MSIFGWLTKFISRPKPTWRDAFFAASHGNEISSALKKELQKKRIEPKIIQAVMSECKLLHPSANIEDSIIVDLILASLYDGQRVSSLSELLPALPKKEAEKIAGDISFSTQFNLSKYRALSLGLNWYRWMGAQICPLHKHMKDVFVRWDTPPSIDILKDGSPIPHHAGSQWGCKCHPETVVEVKRMYKPPYKVCLGDKIIIMSQQDFLKILK